MKTVPFLFSGSAALHPHAAADLLLSQAGKETVSEALSDLQTNGKLPPSLRDAVFEFQESSGDGEEALRRLADAIQKTPPHQWRRVTLYHERHALQLSYLYRVGEDVSRLESLNPQDSAAIRSLQSGLNAFVGSEFLREDAGQVDLFCRRVAQTLQNAAFQTMAASADILWPSLETFLETAQTEGYLDFSYHPRSSHPLEADKEEKIQSLAAFLRNQGITWPYRFVEWTRSLYLAAGDLKNGHKKSALLALSRSMATLFKTQSLTEGDLRKELGGASLIIGIPLPDFPNDWPNDLTTTTAKWLINVWDTARESPDWKDLEVCIDAWVNCWRDSQSKAEKETIRYELTRWLNNTDNSVTWRYTGDVGTRIEELNTILVQVGQDSLETFRSTRAPSPLRASWRKVGRSASPMAGVPEGFHFGGRLKAEVETAEPSPPTGPGVDENIFSALPTLSPERLAHPAPLIPALDATWLASVMAAAAADLQDQPTPLSDVTPSSAEVQDETPAATPVEAATADLQDQPTPHSDVTPPSAEVQDETPTATPVEAAPLTNPTPRDAQRLWTKEMKDVIKTLLGQNPPVGRDDLIQWMKKNCRAQQQKVLANSVLDLAVDSPHQEKIREHLSALSSGTQASATQYAAEGFLSAIALLVHPELFFAPISADTPLVAWAKAISPFVTGEEESLPGWILIRKAIVEALASGDGGRHEGERLTSATGAHVPELLLQIVQNRPLAIDDRWQALMRLQLGSATGKEPSPDDAQKTADLMQETAQAMQRVDLATVDDIRRLKTFLEEAQSGLRLCREVLGALIDGEDPCWEPLVETEDLFRQIAESAEFALLEREEVSDRPRSETPDSPHTAASATTNGIPQNSVTPSEPQKDALLRAESEALAKLAILKSFAAPDSLTPAEYASVSAQCLPVIDHFLQRHEAFKKAGGEKDKIFPRLQETARELRAEGLKWLAWEDDVPLAAPVERPGPPSFLGLLAMDRDFQISPTTRMRALIALSAIPEQDYWRVNNVLELAIFARDEQVYERLIALYGLVSGNGNDGHAVLVEQSQGSRYEFYPRSSWKGSRPPWIDDIPASEIHGVTDLSDYTPKLLQEYIKQPRHYYRNKLEFLYNLLSHSMPQEVSLQDLLRQNPHDPRSRAWNKMRNHLYRSKDLDYFTSVLEGHPQLSQITESDSFFTKFLKSQRDIARQLAVKFLGDPHYSESVARRIGVKNLVGPMMQTTTIRRSFGDFDTAAGGPLEEYRRTYIRPLSGIAPSNGDMDADWRRTVESALLVSTPSGTHLILREEDKKRVRDYFDGNRAKNISFEDPLTERRIALRKHGAGYRMANAWDKASGWHRELLRRLFLLVEAEPFYLEVAKNMLQEKNPALEKMVPELIRSIMRDTGGREATLEDVRTNMVLLLEAHCDALPS